MPLARLGIYVYPGHWPAYSYLRLSLASSIVSSIDRGQFIRACLGDGLVISLSSCHWPAHSRLVLSLARFFVATLGYWPSLFVPSIVIGQCIHVPSCRLVVSSRWFCTFFGRRTPSFWAASFSRTKSTCGLQTTRERWRCVLAWSSVSKRHATVGGGGGYTCRAWP